MSIVAFTGKKGHGKDTAAKALIQCGFVQIAFADPLREIVKIAYGITDLEMTDRDLKEKPLDRYPFLSPRVILTKIGTEGFRELIEDGTWVKAFERSAAQFKNVVITDLRFLNEEIMLKAHGALILRVVDPRKNDTDEFSNHKSESEMDAIKPHYTIRNVGTVADLHDSVLAHVAQWLED